MARCPTCGSDPERELVVLSRDIAALSQLQGELAQIREILFGPQAHGSSPPGLGTVDARPRGTVPRVGTAP